MHITSTTVQVLGELFECKRPIARIWTTISVMAIMVLLGSIKALAEQSISQYNPTNPLVIARQEATKAGIDPNLVLAIMQHESNSCKTITTPNTDLGCMQISRATATALGLNTERLVNDRAYNIKAGVAILMQFKRYKAYDKLWWARYNVGYQKLPIIKANYAKKVGYK